MDTKVMGRFLSVSAKKQKLCGHDPVPGVPCIRIRGVKVIRFVPWSVVKWSPPNGTY